MHRHGIKNLLTVLTNQARRDGRSIILAEPKASSGESGSGSGSDVKW